MMDFSLTSAEARDCPLHQSREGSVGAGVVVTVWVGAEGVAAAVVGGVVAAGEGGRGAGVAVAALCATTTRTAARAAGARL